MNKYVVVVQIYSLWVFVFLIVETVNPYRLYVVDFCLVILFLFRLYVSVCVIFIFLLSYIDVFIEVCLLFLYRSYVAVCVIVEVFVLVC